MRAVGRVFRADRGDAGQRLDVVLQRHLADRPDASRTRIQEWIRAGAVSLSGEIASRAAARVASDAEIIARLPELPSRRAPGAEDRALDVLYEDDVVMAVNKPPGLVVHPSHGHASGTLLNALLWHARAWPAGTRPSLVHRLDKLTSGVLLAAKTRAVHAQLARAMREGRVEKDYLALVLGRVAPARGEIALPLARDPLDRRRVIVVERGGRACSTRYERLVATRGRQAGLALLRCRLMTGRMHQIRVHLAAAGWPIVGDPVYGRRALPGLADPALDAVVVGFARQALHACRIAFDRPADGRRIEVVAPVPGDMAALLAAAGLEHDLTKGRAGRASPPAGGGGRPEQG